MDKKICGVTGHRKIPAEYAEQVKQGLLYEIEKAVADGYTCFISGFSEGAEQLFAEIVLEKQRKIRLCSWKLFFHTVTAI